VPWSWQLTEATPPPGLTGAEAKTAAAGFGVDTPVGLQGAESKAATGKLTPQEVAISLASSATVLRAAEELLELDAGSIDASVGQHPAAYRFTLRQDDKIDVLPEPPEPEDREFALATYHELVAKVRELHERLQGTNSAGLVRSSVERLLTALGTEFDEISPGVCCSHDPGSLKRFAPRSTKN
jgi:hypothetical protein